MERLLKACRERLATHYGHRFVGLVLYGSEARREASPRSDIDLLVLLHDPFDRFEELRVIVDLLFPVQLESDRLISARPVRVEDYEHGTLELYRNAQEDGVAI